MLQGGHERLMDRQTDGRTDGQGESNIPPLTSLRGYNKCKEITLLKWLPNFLGVNDLMWGEIAN